MKENAIRTKSFDFAIDIVVLYKKLISGHKEYIMSRQLLKSGTSIGSNVREAEFAASKADFTNNNDDKLKKSKRNRLLVGTFI
jgi:four helix bundle protein